MEKLLLYGIQAITQRVIPIRQAAPGLSCNCHCPNPKCNGILIARNQGQINQPHYAHKGDPCENPSESALHALAKQLIADNTWIRLTSGKIFTYTSTAIEQPLGKRRIDVMLYNVTTDESLAVEIKVTCAMCQEKIDEIRAQGIPVLEIDLAGYPQEIDSLELTNILIEGTDNKEDFQLLVIEPSQPFKINWPLVFSIIALLVLGIWAYCNRKKPRKKRYIFG